MASNYTLLLAIFACPLIIGLIVGVWVFKRTRGLVTAIHFEADGVALKDRRGLHGLRFSKVRRISAVSVDKLGFESWGLEIQTSRESFYIDEDIEGFSDLLEALGAHFEFDAAIVESDANAALIARPFKGFQILLWT